MDSKTKSKSPIWIVIQSSKRNMPYYYNTKTKESVWDKPEGCDILDKSGESTLSHDSKLSPQDDIEDYHLIKHIENPGANRVNFSPKSNEHFEQMLAMKRKLFNKEKEKSPSKKGDENRTLVCYGNELDASLLTNKLEQLSKQLKDKDRERKKPFPVNKITSIHNQARVNQNPTNVKTPMRKPLIKDRLGWNPNSNSNQNCLQGRNENGAFSGAFKRRPSPIEGLSDHGIQIKKPSLENAPKIIKISPKVQNTTNETTTSHFHPEKNPVPNKVFDLRTKLEERRKELSSAPTAAVNGTSEMDWEEADTCWAEESGGIHVIRQRNDNTPINTAAKEKLTVPGYKKMYLVCDTCALVDDHTFLDSLVARGKYLGIPVVVVIPFVVIVELDKLKVKTDQNLCQTARKIQRIISCSRKDNTSLRLQDGDKSKEAVGSLDICNNDDLVLNCCLQIKETCKEDELPILVTSDVNLQIKATTYKLTAYNWVTFKQWARGYKEEQRCSLQHGVLEKKISPVSRSQILNSNNGFEDEKMDVDSVVNELELNQHSPIIKMRENIKLPSDVGSEIPALQNNLRSHLHELMVDFQAFLHTILDKAVENLYGQLKNHGLKITPSWTLMDYITEISNRWQIITSHRASPKIKEMLTELRAAVKKYRSAREDFTVADVEDIFSLCRSVTNMFVPKFGDHATNFLKLLKNHREEWEVDYKRSLSMLNGNPAPADDDISVQPVDLALQNIHTCLHSDYEDLKKQIVCGKVDDQYSLSLLFENITNFVVILSRVLEENPNDLTTTNENVCRLQKMVSNFSDVKGNRPQFDITVENVVELLQDNSYRTTVKQTLDNFTNLQKHVDALNLIDG